jgi:glycosyltransferase involved in cell wall biosynthesis
VTERARTPVAVCFVASHAQLGGAELYLESLLGALGPEWIAELLVLGEGPFVDRLRAAGFDVRVVPCGRRAGLVAGAARMRRILLERRPQLVHANGVKAALVSALATRATGIPVVWHKHDSARDGRVGRWIARRCALVVGVSASAVSALAGARGVSTTVVPNGIPRHEVERGAARQALLESLQAGSASKVVGMVGRLHPGKNQLELVEIAHELRERLAELRLVFVGAADPHEPAYEQRVRARVQELGLGGCVTFLGQRSDAVRITAGCDVLATPSVPDPVSGWREGAPLSPLEAMAVGTPVAGYAEPGLREVLGQCAELVPTGDRRRLLEALRTLLESEEARERLRACGLQRIRRYELPEAAERMQEAYVAVAKA